MIKIHDTNWIVTPVYLEFIGGARDSQEMELFKAFLGELFIVDKGIILPEDWTTARRLAERIPFKPYPSPRGAMDCLIKAIAIRL